MSDSLDLYRYTSIPALLDMLLNERLLLSNPKSWTDRTDVDFLEKYANNGEVRALCFFQSDESNLYWELYAKFGCLIQFDKEKLTANFNKKDFRHNPMEYPKQKDLKKIELELENIPFLKQYRYRKENEYRLIWKGSKKKAKNISIDINLDSIKKIIISGNIEKEEFKSLEKIINEIIEKKITEKKIKSRITVSHSRIFHNIVLINKTSSFKKKPNSPKK